MPYPTLDQIVDELSELRPLNPVAQRIIALAEDERFSAHELAAVIASDAALTARMLKLANSAYYGFPRRISTVRDAVVLLGFRAVRATTLATCLIDAMPGGRVLDEAAFWRFSVSVGMLAELLARAEGVAPDEAFTAGVLHGIGRLALDQGLPDGLEHAVRHAQQHELTLLDAELDVLGYSDAQLGATLCERWALPAPLVEAVAGHMLDVERLPPEGSLTSVVVRARVFARSSGLSDGIEVAVKAPPRPEWAAPPLSVALDRAGGIEGVLGRVSAFIDSAIVR